jgi:hypothetical protein
MGTRARLGFDSVPQSHARLVIEEADPRLLERGLDTQRGRDVAHAHSLPLFSLRQSSRSSR